MREQIFNLMDNIMRLPSGTINENSVMEDIPEWDSLAHVLIIGELEEKLGIEIPLDEAVEITTVKEILEKAGV